MLPSFLVRAFKGFRHRHPIYLVGGSVRDALLRRPCHDWDFACRDARGAARRLQRSLRAKLITLDDVHKIYRLIVPSGLPAERLTVDFAELVGGSIEKDLGRRDFTMNAMAVQLGRDEMIDPFKGRSALKTKKIAVVSNRIFREDPVRLLRAFRLASQLDFKITPPTLRLIRREASRIHEAAPERLREELLRLLSEPCTAPMIEAMDRAGLLTLLFPELEICRRCAVRFYGKGGVLRHSLNTLANLDWLLARLSSNEWRLLANVSAKLTEYIRLPVGGFPRSAWLKLAALLHDVGKPATAQRIKGRLRFFGHEEVVASLAHARVAALRCSRQESQLIRQWVGHHMRPGSLASAPSLSDKAIGRFFRDLGENGPGMLLVSLADHYDYLARAQWGKGRDPVEKLVQRCLGSYYTERQKVLPPKLVDGHQLMRVLKLKSGPLIGKLLEAIQDAQAEGKVSSKEEAFACAKKWVSRFSRHPRLP